MNKMKKVLALTLTLATCASMSTTVFADEASDENPFKYGSIVSQEDEKSFGAAMSPKSGTDQLSNNFIKPKSIYNLYNVSLTEFNLFEPLTEYVANREYQDSDTFPSVSCEIGTGFTLSADVNTSVGLDAGFVSEELGFTVGGSYSMHTTQVYPIKCIVWKGDKNCHKMVSEIC